MLLSTTRWRCAYWPVRIDARLGEQSAVVTNAFRQAHAAPGQRIDIRRLQPRVPGDAHGVEAQVVDEDEDDVAADGARDRRQLEARADALRRNGRRACATSPVRTTTSATVADA